MIINYLNNNYCICHRTLFMIVTFEVFYIYGLKVLSFFLSSSFQCSNCKRFKSFSIPHSKWKNSEKQYPLKHKNLDSFAFGGKNTHCQRWKIFPSSDSDNAMKQKYIVEVSVPSFSRFLSGSRFLICLWTTSTTPFSRVKNTQVGKEHWTLLYTERKRKLGEWRRERVRDKQRECCKREKEGLESVREI
jgi:hypothetical protein